MKNSKNILLIILYFICSLLFFALGIYKLCGFNETCQTTLVGAVEFFENEHSINGLIPISTSYYYLGITSNDELVIVQANPNWLNDNFDADGCAKNAQGITIKGEITRLPYNAQSYVEDVFEDYLDYSIPLGQTHSINILYTDAAIHSVIVSFLIFLWTIAAVILWKKEALKEKLKEKIKQNRALLLGSVIFVILILYYIVYVAMLLYK